MLEAKMSSYNMMNSFICETNLKLITDNVEPLCCYFVVVLRLKERSGRTIFTPLTL